MAPTRKTERITRHVARLLTADRKRSLLSKSRPKAAIERDEAAARDELVRSGADSPQPETATGSRSSRVTA